MSASIQAVSNVIASTHVVSVATADGAQSELICTQPAEYPKRVMYWLPAMGVPAKHYLPLAEAFAAHGVAMALHEWRGIGSSNRRAGRQSNWGYRQLLETDIAAGMAEAKTRWPQAELWMGGHSLGGQLSCLYASRHRGDVAGLALVASGSPYWRRFKRGSLILAAYALVTPISRLIGYLPGRRIGFGGNEARDVIADWSRSGRTGRYAANGIVADFERELGAFQRPVLAMRLRDDWLAPLSSLEWLLDKMPKAPRRVDVVAPEQLAGQSADHFTWMKVPDAIAAQLAAWMDTNFDHDT
ncbi:alpha/beta fold hydrolase [Dyella sp. 2HG41-7]|uniref:alpha/beta hydrolase family protein n=1 Tax=Dyella sp. 2HG41-7 TaxID=2883239 RepID=UPI001F39CBFC|nr:alpha/beta fold hydrolase [Dyella sp. 2HG41-7]